MAETGADLSTSTAAHLASWAGTCPGSNESAGRIKSTTTRRPGNPYLKAALGTAALSIANTRNTYLAAKYPRIAARRGPKKALVALEHAILIAIWNMAHTGAEYDDPGADYYTRRDPERTRLHALTTTHVRRQPDHEPAPPDSAIRSLSLRTPPQPRTGGNLRVRGWF